MKRALKINGTDNEMVIGISTTVNVGNKFLYLEELPDKQTWRMTRTLCLIPDFSKIKELRFKHGTKTIKGGTVAALEAVEVIDTEGNVIDTWPVQQVISVPAQAGDRFVTFEGGVDKKTGKEVWRIRHYTSVIPSVIQCSGLTMIRED